MEEEEQVVGVVTYKELSATEFATRAHRIQSSGQGTEVYHNHQEFLDLSLKGPL